MPWSATVTAQASVASKTVRYGGYGWLTAFQNARLIGHFESVRHVAGERGVDNGCAYTVILHNIKYRGDKIACLPGKSASGFKYDFNIGLSKFEIVERFDKQVYVVAFSCHEMSASHVYPLELREEMPELLFECRENLVKIFGR